MKKNSFDIRYAALLLLIGVFYLLLEWNTVPTLADDLIYEFKFNMAGDYSHPQHIESIGDVVGSMSSFYQTINGRYITQFLAIAFISLVPKHIVDVINAVLFVLLIHLSMVFLRAEKDRLSSTGLLISTMFLAIKGFQSSMLWNCGIFSYLWVLVPTLAFLIVLRTHGSDEMKWYHWLACIPALLVGWGHEGLALPLVIGLAVLAIQHRRTFFHSVAFPMMVYYVVGAALCFSPAVWNRAGNDTSLVHRLMTGCVVIFLQSRVLWLTVLAMIVTWFKNRHFLQSEIKEKLWLWITCLLCYGIAFACGESNYRVNFFAEFLSLLLLIDILRAYSLGFRNVASIIVSVAAIAVYIPALHCLRLQVKDYDYAEKQMKTPGITLIRTHSTLPHGKLMNWIYNTYVVPFASYGYFSVYMGFDANDTNMRCAAVKYHKPHMIFLPERLTNMIDNGTVGCNSFTLDNADNLYAIRLADKRDVHKVVFNLGTEDQSKLHFWQRAVAEDNNSVELDDFHWQVIDVDGRRVLVLTKPLTNVLRRLKSISFK